MTPRKRGDPPSLQQLISEAEYAVAEHHLAKAEALYRQALRQLDLACDHAKRATLLNKLQHIVEAQGNYAEATLLREQLAKLLERDEDTI